MKDINILDCTLRDGGYINDWNFDEETYFDIVSSLCSAGVDIVELGILGKPFAEDFSTRYVDLKKIIVPEEKKGDTRFSVMGSYPEIDSYKFPNKQLTHIDIIRVAFFKEDYVGTLQYANSLKQLGYEIFLQAMATFMYSSEELQRMLYAVNEIQPAAFYMVDSFGLMYPEDVLSTLRIMDDCLVPEISVGFHAHNNIQMAFSNSMLFIKEAKEKERSVCVDGSLYGMGRGAGNTCIELLADGLNKKYGKAYQTEEIDNVIERRIKKIQSIFPWGYSNVHLLASREKLNAAYIWYMNKKGITEYDEMKKVIRAIPPESRHKLMKGYIDSYFEEKNI